MEKVSNYFIFISKNLKPKKTWDLKKSSVYEKFIIDIVDGAIRTMLTLIVTSG